MVRKRFRRICAVAAAFGLFLMLGAAGASDCNTLPFEQILNLSVIGLALFTGGLWLGGHLS